MYSNVLKPNTNLFLLLALTVNNVAFGSKDFWAQRQEIIAKEDEQAIGSQLELTEQEQCVSDILKDLKLKEWNVGYNNPKQFHPSRHFFETSSFIEQSPVFYFLKNLPKGALLHTHFYGMVSSEFIYNLTYSEDLFACYHEDRMLLHFFYDHVDNRCDWLPVRYLRKADKMFDKRFKSNAFMANIAESKPFDDNTDAEYAFTQAKDVLFGLISYKPIFYKYFYRGLEELYEDGVLYVELRSTVLPVYDLEGNVYESYEVVQMMKEIVEEFKCSHPSFIGAKLIYSGRKIVTDEEEDIRTSVQRVLAVAKYFPDFVVGYDVMRREEMKDVLADLLEIVQSQPDLKFFFHAGATNWIGALTDLNVLDSILLNTYRIGHGLSLVKHPELLRIIKERNIPIEICPISNQVFGLITDLRNHPATHFLSHGYPVVIGNDDPGLWNAKGVTYDWYMVFMGMANVDRDLRMLKQLAINSIIYSGMDDREKGLVEFAKMWNSFINSIPRCNRDPGSGDDPDGPSGATIVVQPEVTELSSGQYVDFSTESPDYGSSSIDSIPYDSLYSSGDPGSGDPGSGDPVPIISGDYPPEFSGSGTDRELIIDEVTEVGLTQAGTIGPVEEVTEYGTDVTVIQEEREVGSDASIADGFTDSGIVTIESTTAGTDATVTGVDREGPENTVSVVDYSSPASVTTPTDGSASTVVETSVASSISEDTPSISPESVATPSDGNSSVSEAPVGSSTSEMNSSTSMEGVASPVDDITSSSVNPVESSSQPPVESPDEAQPGGEEKPEETATEQPPT